MAVAVAADEGRTRAGLVVLVVAILAVAAAAIIIIVVAFSDRLQQRAGRPVAPVAAFGSTLRWRFASWWHRGSRPSP